MTTFTLSNKTITIKRLRAMKTELRDFRFEFVGYGHYKVTYISPVTGKQWSKTVNDMTIIDATRNDECPKRKDLERLKQLVKRGF